MQSYLRLTSVCLHEKSDEIFTVAVMVCLASFKWPSTCLVISLPHLEATVIMSSRHSDVEETNVRVVMFVQGCCKMLEK